MESWLNQVAPAAASVNEKMSESWVFMLRALEIGVNKVGQTRRGEGDDDDQGKGDGDKP